MEGPSTIPARTTCRRRQELLRAAGRQYDLIFSEPSEPWVSGVAGLFSEEFYRQVSRYLSPRGVFAQWIHLYDLDDRLVLTVLTAIDRTFRDYEVFLPTPTANLIVATGAGLPPPTGAWSGCPTSPATSATSFRSLRGAGGDLARQPHQSWRWWPSPLDDRLHPA
jgi:hypothetical protein